MFECNENKSPIILFMTKKVSIPIELFKEIYQNLPVQLTNKIDYKYPNIKNYLKKKDPKLVKDISKELKSINLKLNNEKIKNGSRYLSNTNSKE